MFSVLSIILSYSNSFLKYFLIHKMLQTQSQSLFLNITLLAVVVNNAAIQSIDTK